MIARHRLKAVVGGVFAAATIAGCGTNDAPAGVDVGPVEIDAGAAIDAGSPRDAGIAIDTVPPDDARSATDGGPDDSGGRDLDAATDLDVGPPVDAPTLPDAGPTCPTFGAPVELGYVADPGLAELSGLVESRVTPGILFGHGDNNTDLFAVRASDGDVRGHWTLRSGGRALGAGDVEDIAMGPMPGGGTGIYLGDIGSGTSAIRIARLPEPVVPLTGTAASGALDAEVMNVANFLGLAIPNAETLLVDPLSGDVVIVQKDGAAHPCALGPFVAGATVTPDCSAPAVPGLMNPSAGDVSPDGRYVVLRNETLAYVWVRPAGASLIAAFGALRCPFPTLEHTNECNGEAVAFAADGRGVFSGSERVGTAACAMPHIHSYTFTP